jgi:hypothetical protein
MFRGILQGVVPDTSQVQPPTVRPALLRQTFPLASQGADPPDTSDDFSPQPGQTARSPSLSLGIPSRIPSGFPLTGVGQQTSADLDGSGGTPLVNTQSDWQTSASPILVQAQAENSAPAQADDSGSLSADAAATGKAADPLYARSYDQAQTAIAADDDLNAAVRLADRAGDKGFRDRLAAIIADLGYDRAAALDTIRQEVFAGQMRARGPSLADAAAGMQSRLPSID